MTHPTTEAIARIIDPKAWAYIDQHSMQHSLSAQMSPDGSLYKAAEISALVEDEIYQLRLAITGGEDAPGYVMSLPLKTILDVQEENQLAHREDIDRAEQFLPHKELLSDLRSLRQEHADLNGGGPGWNTRWEATWAKVDDLFADEDEAAWERAQESAQQDAWG